MTTAVRLLIGWCGVSLLIGGFWALLWASIRRRDIVAGVGALGMMVLGGVLLWLALSTG